MDSKTDRARAELEHWRERSAAQVKEIARLNRDIARRERQTRAGIEELRQTTDRVLAAVVLGHGSDTKGGGKLMRLDIRQVRDALEEYNLCAYLDGDSYVLELVKRRET